MLDFMQQNSEKQQLLKRKLKVEVVLQAPDFEHATPTCFSTWSVMKKIEQIRNRKMDRGGKMESEVQDKVKGD